MRYLSIILLFISCSNLKTSEQGDVIDTAAIQSSAEKQIQPATASALSDTTAHGFSIHFTEITKKEYDSLWAHTIATNIPLSPFTARTRTFEHCQIVALNNGLVDSLCNMDDGEYYEKYEIKGLWQDKQQLLVNFGNWEEVNDFLIDLNDGSYFILGPFYELSPDRNAMLTYVDFDAIPLYATGELSVTRIESGSLKVLYKKDLGETTVKDAGWISASECLIVTASVDTKTDLMSNTRTYRMKIEH